MLNIMNLMTVPLEFAKVQSTATKNVLQITSEISQSSNNGVPILTSTQNLAGKGTNTPTRTLNDRMIIKRNRMFRNRLSAKVSREKWKLHKNLLEKQLESLKKEKLRLLFENEELRLQQNQLEEENLSLKMRFEEDGEEVCGSAFEHAEGMGSPTILHSPHPHACHDFQQLPVTTVPDLPILEDLDSIFELCDATNFYEKPDVFVCPLSQHMTEETAFNSDAAVARLISKEVEVCCMDEEMNSDPTSNLAEELVFDDIEFPQSDLGPPEMWTFDDLFEDLDDSFSFCC